MTTSRPDITVRKRVWPLQAPFAVTGHTWHEVPLAYVRAAGKGGAGHAEGAPLFYRNETADDLVESIEAVLRSRPELLTREHLTESRLPPGAQNAVDCALWDLDCKASGKPVWELAGLGSPRPLETVVTITLDEPRHMGRQAGAHSRCPILKIKLDGKRPADCLKAVRLAAPRARLVVDANCAWTIDELANLEPALVDAGVEMVEQPMPPERDADLTDYRPPYKLCADESCQNVDSLPDIAGKFDMINIKLDKAGGFTASLELARRAKAMGFELMVGNMLGSSLAMAPAYYLGLLCTYVDIDGPVYLTRDCEYGFSIRDGVVAPPPRTLWG